MPATCLAAATAWRAGTVIRDVRWVRRCDPDQRVYRTGLGWTSPAQQASRGRWASAGLSAALLLLAATLLARASVLDLRTASLLSAGACLAIILWLLRDRTLHHGRYTSVCMATLALTVLVGEIVTLVPRPAGAAAGLQSAGLLASFFASQLYLVAGLRKLRAPHFMTGRVLADTLAFSFFQAAAGNREFVRVVRAEQLAALLRSRRFLLACRVAAVLTVAAELVLGAGALGLLPVGATLALALVTHGTFTLISPRRLFPFSAAAIGLLALALVHPIAGLGA